MNRPERRRIRFRVDPLYVNLGIDFGTSYTKVCYRNVGSEQSGILTFGREPYLRSIVFVDEYRRLSTPIGNNDRGSKETFLKMRIGDNAQEAMYVQALSSYYLAEIIRGAKREFMRQETELAAGRQIIWSANIGVIRDSVDVGGIERCPYYSPRCDRTISDWTKGGGPDSHGLSCSTGDRRGGTVVRYIACSAARNIHLLRRWWRNSRWRLLQVREQ